ncbi:MAG: hypothetical protein HFP77_03055 [Methylococcales symbiont of Iophon sp. n. MRB-2018]|nr:MAG: hypothetical protein HFP77_03055 [Methylococcales symbiont of Iophon sp. n. MRB-2018]KAF3980333.1 MAG: hypothetical protein HFP76_02630 [Methylococcales symbiont of Iophon sp. n. MRB-2018]
MFVFEGKKTESKYLKIFLEKLNIKIDKNRIEVAFCTDIYQLYEKIQRDPMVDTFELLKEFRSLNGSLDKLERDEITSIYLFFDYDGHAPLASDKKIDLMLSQFNDETDQGKLFISFPMLESLKDKKTLKKARSKFQVAEHLKSM